MQDASVLRSAPSIIEARGLGWTSPPVKRMFASLVLLAVLAFGTSLSAPAASSSPSALVSVIVREMPGAGDAPEALIKSLGGEVGRPLKIIGGFEAMVPVSEIDQLIESKAIHSVTPNSKLHLNQTEPPAEALGYDPVAELGSMYNTTHVTGATDYWSAGFTGAGVDVAVLDSGVVPINGLSIPGKVINGPDLSFESQADNLRYLDTYGHGTHMSSIIAGRDNEISQVDPADTQHFMGMAPDARIINLKVADAVGATDVSQVLAAIDWIVQHRTDDGMNIRVLNLSFGTDGVQNYVDDPLTYAVEVAWHHGIVVVVSGGNEGFGSAKLNNPAYDPYVIAVGASRPNGTLDVSDDTVPDFSSCGNQTRRPDLVAPGKSIVALKAPGSATEINHPAAALGTRFVKGSGTSQSAAVISGAAALVIQQRPSITPDQVKALLMGTANTLPVADNTCQGDGTLDLGEALTTPTPETTQTWPLATGLGSLELSRGSAHLSEDGIDLAGEVDVHGLPFDAAVWSGKSWSGSSWTSGSWNGADWAGEGWITSPLTGKSWSGKSWSGSSWSGKSWSGKSWSGKSWSGNSWSTGVWTGMVWASSGWSANIWSGSGWGD